jgi:hypothetical protein
MKGPENMAEDTDTIMQKAQSRFLATQKKTAERNEAMSEYQAETAARAAKTAKLRALRLARDEAERAEAEAAAKTEKPKKKRAPAKPKKAASSKA